MSIDQQHVHTVRERMCIVLINDSGNAYIRINSNWDVGYVWYGMVWYGMVWYGMVWYGMVWYYLNRYFNEDPFLKEDVQYIS